MPHFVANLTMLWPELKPYDRFRAAADAGFREVEMLFVHELDARQIERLLSQLGLRMVLFDPAAGNWNAGERGLMCLPGREGEYVREAQVAVDLARRFGTEQINILAGIPPTSASVELIERTALANLLRAAELADNHGVEVLVENINEVDVPGYWLGTIAKAAGLVKASRHPRVRLQFDQYHASVAGEEPVRCFHEHIDLIGHVQIADAPGRHQPGTGLAPIATFLDSLDQGGYTRFVGLEYKPLGSTAESLEWMKNYSDRHAAGPDQ